MSTSIRRIRPEDASELRRMRLAALTDMPSAFGSTLERELAFSDADWSRRATQSSTGPDSVMFFAEADSEIVGLVGGFRTETATELVSMWVTPDARDLGVGRQLVDAVTEWAQEQPPERVELWVTRGNAAALRLYETSGFRVTGDHQPLPSDPCVDEIRMRREL
ncbi:MAG: N-acetyltransferase family protein [Ilumatobacter sp.]